MAEPDKKPDEKEDQLLADLDRIGARLDKAIPLYHERVTNAFFTLRYMEDKLVRHGGRIEISRPEGGGLLVKHHHTNGKEEQIGWIPPENRTVTGR